MKRKATKLTSLLLTMMMIVGIFAAMPLMAFADDNDPFGVDDFYTVTEASSTDLGSVLDNDNAGLGATVGKIVWNGVEYDVPADGFKFTTPLGGIVNILQDGTSLYFSPQRYNSGVGVDTDGPDTDTFRYRVKDANGELSEFVTVYIDILDTVPVAVDDDYTLSDLDADTPFSANVMDNDVLSADWVTKGIDGIRNVVWQIRADDASPIITVSSNPYDPNGQPMLETAMGGKVWINWNGDFEYALPPLFLGSDSFQYQLTDGDNSPSDWATVTFSELVEVVTLTSITVTMPIKTDYIRDENLDLTGMIVTADYSDGSSIEVTDYTTDPANDTVLDTVGIQTIIVSYTEDGITETAAFTVTVENGNRIIVCGVELEYRVENGIAILEPTWEQMQEILANSGGEIIIDLSDYAGVDFRTPAAWFKDVDKTITFITANGTATIKTKTLWNNSGKDRLVEIRNGVASVKNV